MSTAKRHAASLMGISPRALSHYLTKYRFSTRARCPGANPSSVLEGFMERRTKEWCRDSTQHDSAGHLRVECRRLSAFAIRV